MATLIFSSLGTLVGGPVGGAIGALVGRQFDTTVLGAGSRSGPRLKELTPTTSSYGSTIPRLFGKMRVAGSIVWATDLAEHSEAMSSGKAGPTVTTYSYTASFAVALASRRIGSIGRIWADGNLLRGVAGDLKVGGSLRIYDGSFDQMPDPLIAAAEGADRCPAYRGLAYVVFEDLDLSDFYNRIPSLTFEVISDSGDVSLEQIVSSAIDEVDAGLTLTGVEGFSCEATLTDTLALLDPMFPMACDAAGETLVFARERLQASPLTIGEAALPVSDDDFGKASGYTRKRAPVPTSPPEIIRYYDVDRDYLPGSQRAQGRAGAGQPDSIDLPGTMSAASARNLAEVMAGRALWARETLAWRTAELDLEAGPGAIVMLPGLGGRWHVDAWEWRDAGVELSLTRVVPVGADTSVTEAVDSGRINSPIDALAAATVLDVVELPWDGNGSGDAPIIVAAVCGAGSNWKGAALFADDGDGNLRPLGPSGRAKSIVGTTEAALPLRSPLLIDRYSTIVIRLADASLSLANADSRQLAQGANRALVGDEIVQFASAIPLGGARWQLGMFLRGRGGTEAAVGGHVAVERFVLLDGPLLSLDAALVGSTRGTSIVAAGLGDASPVTSEIMLRGITRRPLAPVHGQASLLPGGGLSLTWTRRSRGAWAWEDGVDTPLHEEAESYQVSFGDPAAPLASWTLTQPQLSVDPDQAASLAAALPGGALCVRQVGSYAVSDALFLTSL